LRIAKQQADQGESISLAVSSECSCSLENAPKDKASRRYFSAVERALASFDTAQQEWADYISFLARLLKALQSHPADVHVIPECYTIATRLAQCLSPALPSGVHQKALEVYSFVFDVIGVGDPSAGLSRL
jgi:Dopey, N-terminal